MIAKDKQIFEALVQAYYKGHFEQTLHQIIEEEFDNQLEATAVLGALCGVEIDEDIEDYQFVYQIIEHITQNKVREKILQKVRGCTSDCEHVEGVSRCQSVCPFDAIVKDPLKGEKWIDETMCLYCGRCVQVCESGKYLETLQFLPLAELLKNKQQVIAIVAPAIAGQFGKEVTLDQIREALIQIGFKDMIEVAVAADILSIKEAIEFSEHVQNSGDFMITSCCCPMWVGMLRKVYHDLVDHVSPSVSPMIAMARIIKKLNPESKVVFIGPCVAKKGEAKEKDFIGDVDYVLTFEELQSIVKALDIQIETLEGVPTVEYASRGGRLYARTSGVSQAVWDIVDQLFPAKRHLYSAIQADGIKDCKAMLEQLREGKIKATFVEGMGCQGGCVGGPKAIVPAECGKKAVEQVAYESAIKIPVHSEVLKELLERLGITDLAAFKKQCILFERKFQ